MRDLAPLTTADLLHIFTIGGHTYTFRDVTSLKTNESAIEFGYTAASDGRLKHATFYVRSIAGYSVAELTQ